MQKGSKLHEVVMVNGNSVVLSLLRVVVLCYLFAIFQMFVSASQFARGMEESTTSCLHTPSVHTQSACGWDTFFTQLRTPVCGVEKSIHCHWRKMKKYVVSLIQEAKHYEFGKLVFGL